MTRIQCFLLEKTGRVEVMLRRYRSPSTFPDTSCPTGYGYHNASFPIGDETEVCDEQGSIQNGRMDIPAHDDTRWPTTCPCGYIFEEEDNWQRTAYPLYRRTDTGEEMVLKDLPVGAMYYAEWLDDVFCPQNEHCLVVQTPGGEWIIDSQSSNCSMKDDFRQERHHCWIQHGYPPNVTVDKQGVSCSAGGGSIECNNYHGFLRNGCLVN
jgi:hypothetical protein